MPPPRPQSAAALVSVALNQIFCLGILDGLPLQIAMGVGAAISERVDMVNYVIATISSIRERVLLYERPHACSATILGMACSR